MGIQIIAKSSFSRETDIIHKNTEYVTNFKQPSGWTDAVKQFAANSICTSLDAVQTGKRIHDIFIKNGCDVKDIQIFLNLACPQSIYRWLKGQTLPSIDNLYIMGKIFQLHMDDMLVARDINRNINLPQITQERTDYPLYKQHDSQIS